MAEPITLLICATVVCKNAPLWLASIRGTILDKGREAVFDKGKELAVTKGQTFVQHIFHLDEKEQVRHLEQALKNAMERGLATLGSLQERDQYQSILCTLSQEGPLGEDLRREMMQSFTLSDMPNLAALTDRYNQRQRFFDPSYQDIDAAPYLANFFSALIGELYADPYFKPQLHDVLLLRGVSGVHQSVSDVITLLKKIGETLEDNYSVEDFANDVAKYTAHIERTFRNLKIIGVVPKDQSADPELSGIFVPLRIANQEQSASLHLVKQEQRATTDKPRDSLVALLEEYPCLVLLGGPGSGKSTATKHLAWSHACQLASSQTTLLSGNPLPLRIELRMLNEERKRENYDFLSFTTEVMLKREGIDVNPQMFRELLTRRGMILLFDGLDEVATVHERLALCSEIERFVLSYPGNRVIVTSRPVGYELARVSHPLFAHAEVLPFNDEQIKQFLVNWYSAVLRLSPIPQREQDEMNVLLLALKDNSRLHKLAENPLLLTVMTALHRYERLPDKRVQVYERCADLLLETWAKLKGTDKRWQGMKMSKDDQLACVSYLGFILHTRSQENFDESDEEEDTTVDVPARFLKSKVVEFLRQQRLISEGSEQKKEAERFTALMQEEAGLIVERGTDENGEALYSFVHRTFQEYFAAMDVYERYQQEEDPKIISKFLHEHLHDPHWREVTLLLLGRLKSMPVTKQLRDLLQGKTKSLRSRYVEIVQQDLFFVCDCLVEEIKVESTLVAMVVSRLRDVARTSWSPSQKKVTLQYLGQLMQTKQCSEQATKTLLALVTKEGELNLITRLEATLVLYLCRSDLDEERQIAKQTLKHLLERDDLSIEQTLQIAQMLYRSLAKLETEQLATSMLTRLLKRTDLSIEQEWETAGTLYFSSPWGSEAKLLAISLLTRLLEGNDLSIEQVRQTAAILYRNSRDGSEVQQLVTSIFTQLLARSDLSIEQKWETATTLYLNSRAGSEAKQLATSILVYLLERGDLSIEQMWQTSARLYRRTGQGSEAKQLAASILVHLLERGDLSVEQMRETATMLYRHSRAKLEAKQLAISTFTRLLERDDLSIEQMRQIATTLYRHSRERSETKQLATSIFGRLLKGGNLSIEQTREIAVTLYHSSPLGSGGQQLATSIFVHLLERSDLSIEQTREIVVTVYNNSSDGSEMRQLAISTLTRLLQNHELSVSQAWHTAISFLQDDPENLETDQLVTSILLTLFPRLDTSVEDTDVYNYFSRMVPYFHKFPPTGRHSSSDV